MMFMSFLSVCFCLSFLSFSFFFIFFFFFSSRRRHTRSVSAFLLNRSSDLGHKAASDVRDEFVSVTEKLMDELAQCYNVLPRPDINNTMDHCPEVDEKCFLEN